MSGTVNIARSIFDHELFADQPLTEREAWIWLIMEASWKPRKKRVGDYIADLARGQLAASVRFMAGAWRWSPAKVQRFLSKLKQAEMISQVEGRRVTIVTIENYESFQSALGTPKNRYTSDTDTDTGKPLNSMDKYSSADTAENENRYRSDTNEKKGEIREEDTEAKASDGDAVDPAKALFDAGVKVLGQCGVQDRHARAIVGRWRKDHPNQDGQILTAIMDCRKAGVVDPIPWITARLRPATNLDSIFAKISAEAKPQ